MIDQHASLSEKFLKKGFWLYFFGYIIAPIGYVIKIMVSGEISVSDLGILYGVISLITLLGAFSDLGVGESLKYFIPKFVEKKQYQEIKSVLFYSLILQSFSGLLLLCVFLFGADFISEKYFKDIDAKPILQSFSLFFIGVNLFNLISQFFLSVQNTFYYKFIEFMRNGFILISVTTLIFFDLSQLENIAFSWIIGLYIGLIFAIILFGKKYYFQYFSQVPMIWSIELFKKYFSYSFLVFLSAQAGMILSQIDMQMIIFLLPSQDAGYYSVYLSLIMIPFLIIGPVFALLLPIFSELSTSKNTASIIKLKGLLQKCFGLLGVFFGFYLFSFAPQISHTLFGNSFYVSGEILQYSCLFLLFNFLIQINFNLMGGLGKIKSRLVVTLIAISINIILNIILIKKYGVSGAALATGIGWFFMFSMSEYMLGVKYFSISYLGVLFKNIVFLGLLSYISIQYISSYPLSLSRIQNLFFLLGIGIVWLLFFIIINKTEVKIFIGEIKKIKGMKKA